MKDKKNNATQSIYNCKPQMATICLNRANDKYPNDNLFKTDKNYRMNKYLDFDSNDEQSYQQIHKSIFSSNLDHLSLLCVIRVLYHFNYTSIADYYKGIYYLISFAFIYYFLRVACIHNGYFKSFLQFIFYINSVLMILSSNTPSMLTLRYVTSELFFNYINGMFLNSSYFWFIIYFTMIAIALILKATMANVVSYTLFGYIKALYDANIISAFISLWFFFVFVYYFLEAKREKWALFDSFKKSYLIFDELIFKTRNEPAFVLSKNFAILYANSHAYDFVEELRDNKLKVKKFFNWQSENNILGFSLLDFINPQLKNEFIMRFNRCLSEKMKRFYFPFVSQREESDNNDINRSQTISSCRSQCQSQSNSCDNKSPKTYYTEYNYIVIPSRCVWKNQESYFVSLCKEVIETTFLNYIYSYTNNILEEVANLIHDSDKICANSIDSEIKYEQCTVLLNKLNNKNISGNEHDLFNKIIQQNVPNENNSFIINEDITERVKLNYNVSSSTNNNTQTNYFLNRVKRENIHQLYSNIDHSVLFFFKNQFEVFYDMQLTKEIYTSILLQTLRITNSQLDLNSLANYFAEYFYMILRIKNLKLKFTLKYDHNISVEYSFLRVILFNTLMYIYSITDDDLNEKIINYTISLEKDPRLSSEFISYSYKKDKRYNEMNEDYTFDLFNQNNTHILKFSIVIWDDKQKTNYNEVIKELQKTSSNLFNLKEEIDKVKKLDIGLLTLFYLITAVYSKELEMFSQEGEHTIAFEIGCGIAKLEDEVIQFEENDTNNADAYYRNLLRIVFNVNVPDDEIRNKINNKSSLVKNQYNKKKHKKSISLINKSLLRKESNSSSNDINISYNDIESTKDKNEFKEVKRKGLNKSNYTHNYNFKPIQVKSLLSSSTVHGYKSVEFCIDLSFFTPPKFLIVEDNQFARNQLINLITELNREYQIVIAEDGNIAMSKLKEVYDQNKLYNIVFMDVNLPYKNGIEIATSIRSREKNYPPHLKTKIIGISINPNEKVAQSKLFDHYSK